MQNPSAIAARNADIASHVPTTSDVRLSLEEARAKFAFQPSAPGFHKALKKKVDAYFAETGKSRHADARFWTKAAFWCGTPTVLYFLFVAVPLPLWADWLCVLGVGFCFAGIGFNVSHDGVHGATSSSKVVNRLVGWSFQVIGISTANWDHQHNQLHHTYTNIAGLDMDIDPGPLLRFHAHATHYPWHRLQHIYGWFLYSFTSAMWVVFADFMSLTMKHPRSGRHPGLGTWWSVFGAKVSHLTIMLVLPLLFTPYSWWLIGIMYMTAHMVCGFTIALVFQLAHLVEGPITYAVQDSPRIDDEWAAHQLRTCADFGRGRWLTQFMCGGLNYQTEHHLFPKICHVHYPELSPIVEETAREFGLPFFEHETAWAATKSHYRVLKAMGNPVPTTMPAAEA